MMRQCQALVYVLPLLLLQWGRSLTQVIHGDGRDGPFNPIVAKSVSCGESHFHVHLQFKFPFHGVVRSENSQCIYIDELSAPRKEYDFKVPLVGCSSSRTVNSDTNHVEYRNKLQILRQRDSVDPWALSYTLYCLQQAVNIRSRDTVDQRDALTSEDRVEVRGPEPEVVRSSFTLDGQMKVRFDSGLVFGEGPEGPPINRTVQLGERLSYVFRCDSEANPSTDCAVGSCSARGSSSNVSVELSDANGCSLQPSFWSDFILVDAANAASKQRVYYSANWAWSLHADTNVVISCKLRICPSFCERSPCSNKTTVIRTLRDPSFPTAFETNAEMVIAKSDREVSSDSKNDPAQLAQLSYSPSDRGEAVKVSRTILAVTVSLMMSTIGAMAILIFVLLWKLQKPQ
uniref:ZP domain-containing protein n=1 Tax=Plectus sambesii TaxID=2011161 RepID=A0A914X9U0_9BILA